MSLPTRPVAHAAIESAWGQVIHDRVLAASGCDVHSVNTDSIGTTPAQLDLDTAGTDPGGFLDAANDQIVIPTDKQGLYLINLIIQAVNGATTTETRGYIYVNGSSIIHAIEDNEGGTNIAVGITALKYLSAGDIVQAWAQKRGTGTNPTCHVASMQLLRVTDDYGA